MHDETRHHAMLLTKRGSDDRVRVSLNNNNNNNNRNVHSCRVYVWAVGLYFNFLYCVSHLTVSPTLERRRVELCAVLH